MLYAFWPRRNLRAAIALLTGFAPLVLWIGFSLVYYGFPFPNTAYFKLGGGIPAAELAQHGLFYLYDSLSNDPLALITITASAFLIGRRRQSHSGALGLGAILYLLYVIKIGGDFYSGRFISLPLFTAVIAAAALQAPALRYWPAILLSIVAVGAAIKTRSSTMVWVWLKWKWGTPRRRSAPCTGSSIWREIRSTVPPIPR